MTTLRTFPTSPIGFGCMALSPIYGGTTDDQARRTLNESIDAGITLLDTADVYGKPHDGVSGPAGTNEEMLAPLLAQRRPEVQLATKFGITGIALGEDHRGQKSTDGRPEYALKACDASLQRLGIETIDLYYLHRPDPEVPIEESVGAMAQLVQQGKVRHIGLSEVTADELRRAHATAPITAVQPEWSLWSRDVETHVIPACAELGIGLVPYSPLGRGFLTGTLTREQIATDFRGRTARMGAGWDANQQALAMVSDVAAQIGASNAQVALAWLLHKAEHLHVACVPIPGSRESARMIENLGCMELQIPSHLMDRLDQVAQTIHGDRNISDDPRWISSGRE
ncbi:aldo/keto reductase [Micrococcus luteus]|uniref:aldo/keto reductase n=1 Tax=Micrococcus luteus TaxID=1270 RepID=UPI00100971FC|nr:aldo/keto reductase [Micrococcus luteus]QAV28760.1 aldo/keto reductase [Micrococcus luteus]